MLKELCKTVFCARLWPCGLPRAPPQHASRRRERSRMPEAATPTARGAEAARPPPARHAGPLAQRAPGCVRVIKDVYTHSLQGTASKGSLNSDVAADPAFTRCVSYYVVHSVEARYQGAMSGQHGHERAPGSPTAPGNGGSTYLEAVRTSKASRPAPRPPARERKASTSFR